MSEITNEKIAGIECAIVNPSSSGNTMVIFHGYGANYQDLLPISQMFPEFQKTRWIFPNGIDSLSFHGIPLGRAWFPIDVERLQRGFHTQNLQEIGEDVSRNLERIEPTLQEFLTSLAVPVEKIVLGGFSQGAMLATHLTMHFKTNPKALIIFSGTLADLKNWKQHVAKHANLSFFQSHGESDPILPFFLAERLNEFLLANGWQGEFHRFNGQHEIPVGVLTAFRDFYLHACV